VSVAEGHSPSCQSIEIWRDCLTIATKMADPVIQVINRDEQHIHSGIAIACDGTCYRTGPTQYHCGACQQARPEPHDR
jgi:hypothetical protein